MAKQNESQKNDGQNASNDRLRRPICSALNTKIPITPSALNICRNNFHGSWLQLPLEVLETLARNNYNLPRPRPIDPAVFFDILKIRQLVEDATNLSVRATCGLASSTSVDFLNHSNGRLNYEKMLGIGVGGRVTSTKLSKERKHRMREQATQKLSKAYRLDEIACSVAIMQSASALENVAQLVLQRNSDNIDAKYVHFFHEKIPSRQLAEYTTLQPLNEIIAECPSRSEILRTRAVTKMFKEDPIGAAQDLTTALQICKFYRNQNQNERNQPPPTSEVSIEANQPSGLETQLLFHRAGVYLSIACQNVNDSLLPKRPTSPSRGSKLQSVSNCISPNQVEVTITEKETQQTYLKARRNVKTYAKRALKDYLAYLSHFDYTPGNSDIIPTDVKQDKDNMNDSSEVSRSQIFNNKNCNRQTYHSHDNYQPIDSFCISHLTAQTAAHSINLPAGKLTPPLLKVHNMSSLFSATPPHDLPPYPETPTFDIKEQLHSICIDLSKSTLKQCDSYESLTYHPLMTDALHSLLLCHCLIQTSARELKRHAYMVSRLARICNGYPIFQTARSPSKADWIEILRRCENWIDLSSSWESLCNPDDPLSDLTPSSKEKLPSENQMFVGRKDLSESTKHIRTNDVNSSISFLTRQQQQPDDMNKAEKRDFFKDLIQETGKEYPYITERAYAIVRWINEALPSSNFRAARRKKEITNLSSLAKPNRF